MPYYQGWKDNEGGFIDEYVREMKSGFKDDSWMPHETSWRDQGKAEYARQRDEFGKAAAWKPAPAAPAPAPAAPAPAPSPAPTPTPQATAVARGTTDSLNAAPGVTGSAWMGNAPTGGRNRNSIAALRSRVY